jgi:hypothetical protein
LDLAATAEQVAELAREAGSWDATFPQRRDVALCRLREFRGAALPAVAPNVARWMAASEGAPLDHHAPPGAARRRSTVMAVDGSQIEPDFHELLSCCLINVGWTRFRFGAGAGPGAEMGSRPAVRIGDAALVESFEGVDAAMPDSPSRRVEILRMLAEVQRLRELIEESDPADGAVVALMDGPLVAYWVVKLLDEPARRSAMDAYQALFEAARSRNVALAGYISRTRSSDVANRLRYHSCANVRAGAALCEACSDGFPRGRRACYADLDGIVDRHLFSSMLGEGERSAPFRSAGSAIEGLEAAGHGLRFFYLRAGDDLARVEAPAWVAADVALLDRLHAILLDQVALGRGYPLALCEAHEQAVVRGPDRAAFYDLVRRSCWRGGIYPELSSKLRSKRQPVG